MITVTGTYENGIVRLDKSIQAPKTNKVMVTFLDEELTINTKRLSINDFSFLKSREKSKRYEGSLSDVVIEDRLEEL